MNPTIHVRPSLSLSLKELKLKRLAIPYSSYSLFKAGVPNYTAFLGRIILHTRKRERSFSWAQTKERTVQLPGHHPHQHPLANAIGQ